MCNYACTQSEGSRTVTSEEWGETRSKELMSRILSMHLPNPVHMVGRDTDFSGDGEGVTACRPFKDIS